MVKGQSPCRSGSEGVDSQTPGRVRVLLTLDLHEEIAGGYGLARVGGQVGEQAVLRGRQFDHLAPEPNLPRGEVNDEVASSEHTLIHAPHLTHVAPWDTGEPNRPSAVQSTTGNIQYLTYNPCPHMGELPSW
jgi:hypothetical protein